jgi:hypothetical protein
MTITKELKRRKNPNGVGFIENVNQWRSRIDAALKSITGAFWCPPHGMVFCTHCAEGSNVSEYDYCTITNDDVFFCDNCESASGIRCVQFGTYKAK